MTVHLPPSCAVAPLAYNIPINVIQPHMTSPPIMQLGLRPHLSMRYTCAGMVHKKLMIPDTPDARKEAFRLLRPCKGQCIRTKRANGVNYLLGQKELGHRTIRHLYQRVVVDP